MNTVHDIVDVPKIVHWVPGSNKFLAFIKFTLHRSVPLVLLEDQVIFERLYLVWALVNIQEKQNLVVHLGAFDKLWAHLGDV